MGDTFIFNLQSSPPSELQIPLCSVDTTERNKRRKDYKLVIQQKKIMKAKKTFWKFFFSLVSGGAAGGYDETSLKNQVTKPRRCSLGWRLFCTFVRPYVRSEYVVLYSIWPIHGILVLLFLKVLRTHISYFVKHVLKRKYFCWYVERSS